MLLAACAAALMLAQLVLVRKEISDIKRDMSMREPRLLVEFNAAIDSVTAGAETDEEKCIRIAEYFASEMRNLAAAGVDKPVSHDVMVRWQKRTGACSTRSFLMQRALKRYDIQSIIWNIYDYGFGHTCVMAFYDGGWHFFDPTYAGYFRGDDGRVLSWQEIIADPARAVKNMVVFKNSRDVNSDGSRVDNIRRMNDVYNVQRLSKTRSAGEPGTRIFNIPIEMVLEPDGVTEFGRLDDSSTDMRHPATVKGLKCYYLDSLGEPHENFRYLINIKGLTSESPVAITFHFCEKRAGTPHFKAETHTGRIIEGGRSPDRSDAESWRIVYQPCGQNEDVVIVELMDKDSRGLRAVDAVVVSQIRQKVSDARN